MCCFLRYSIIGGFQSRGKSKNPNFLVQISSGGVGLFHVKGVGAKKSGMSFESQGTKLLGRIFRDFCRDVPGLSGPISRDIAILSLRYPYRAILFKGGSHSPKMVQYPPLLISLTQAHLCDTPFCNVSRDNCAIPHKNKYERVLRYYRYKYRAIPKAPKIEKIQSRLKFSISIEIFNLD